MADAVDLVRQVAQQHGMSGAQVGNFAHKIAKTRSTFAREMQPEEIPLILIDESFLENGSKGVLITDRAVYSDEVKGSLPLENIKVAEARIPAWSESCFGALPTLLLNGERFRSFDGKARKLRFTADAITALSQACRLGRLANYNPRSAILASPVSTGDTSDAGASLPQSAVPAVTTSDAPFIAAGLVCAGNPQSVIVTKVIELGLSQADAEGLVHSLSDIYNAERPMEHLTRIIVGSLLTLVGITLTNWSKESAGPSGTYWVFTGLIGGGVIVALSGLYRMFAGGPKPNANQLLKELRRIQPGQS